MKKIKIVLLSLLMIVSMLSAAAIPAAAETSGVLTYTVNNGTATITKCDMGAQGNMTIPATLGGYPVTAIGDLAFHNCDKLTGVIIPNSVASIGKEAFFECDGLRNVTIGSGVKHIGDSAFGICYLSDIQVDKNNTAYRVIGKCLLETESKTLIAACIGCVIPSDGSVKAIGNFAFFWHNEITTLTIPAGVTTIGHHAFAWCINLVSVSLPSSVTTIGGYAFHTCDKLSSIALSNRLTTIEENAFLQCAALKNVVLPNSVTTLGDGVFSYCTSLKSITLPNTLSAIPDSAFHYCILLAKITIPGSVRSIGPYAFSWCQNITSIQIPAGVQSIGNGVFADCTALTGITVDAGNTAYRSAGNCLIEKESGTLLTGCKTSKIPTDGSVKAIAQKAFSGCVGLTSISIPDSVTVIGKSAFDYCSALTEISIPNRVTSIGENAFAWCSSLASATMGNAVTTIGSQAFEACEKLSAITLPDGVTSIGVNAFQGTEYERTQFKNNLLYIGNHLIHVVPDGFMPISQLSITSNTKCIADYAFSGCGNLTSVSIPQSVTAIGVGVFEGCGALAEITVDPNNAVYRSENNCLIQTAEKRLVAGCKASQIPTDGSVTAIGEAAFNGCMSLTGISVPDAITKIGDLAFAACTNLSQVSFPDAAIAIGQRVLENTAYMQDSSNWQNNALYVGNHLVQTDSYFLSGAYAVKNGTKSIADFALAYSNDLTEVTVPESVGCIGDSAFGESANVRLLVRGGSYAQQYAKTHDLPCTAYYSVAFKQADGSVIAQGDYEAGDAVALPVVPRKPAPEGLRYRFTGWSPAYSPVCTDHVTYTAQYVLEPRPTFTFAGDINGDRDINLQDIVLLARVVAGWDSVADDYVLTAINPDGLGDTNLNDVVFMARCVAGWSGYTLQ